MKLKAIDNRVTIKNSSYLINMKKKIALVPRLGYTSMWEQVHRGPVILMGPFALRVLHWGQTSDTTFGDGVLESSLCPAKARRRSC